MALNETQQLNKLLETSRHILVVFGPRHDLDAICGALSWKNFLEKQHRERDAFYEEVATLIVESAGYSDQESEINKIIDEDVNKVINAMATQ